ncbi:uncharacterized protein LOC132264938 [Phlebotomus argentipes]|uniref:uncharacterized protein LOC132264938 n=1 Tax=Phlebotomus argentipes TaxID=94469 RepID=UPI002892DCE6|nr:uncharacterized protein LOC132264938 [Phlebotomus argentipes]
MRTFISIRKYFLHFEESHLKCFVVICANKGLFRIIMTSIIETSLDNAIVLNLPDFLNKPWFEDILREAENDRTLSITTFELFPGTKPGENFSSSMFKAVVSYTSRGETVDSRSFIVKTMPIEEGFQKDILEEMPVFDREIAFYTEILPEMMKMMKSIGDEEELAPKLIYHSTNPAIIILDDLTKYGYEIHDGFFDFDNTVKVVKKLAKFHALSYFINDKCNHDMNFAKYKTVMTDSLMKKMKIFYDGFDHLKDEVKNWIGFEAVAEKLSTQGATFTKGLMEAFKPHPEDRFNVLCHGDFHVRNMMFIKNAGDIDKTIFLDFQLCFWGSPAVDLLFNLYALGNAECRQRRGEIVLIYHQFLTEYLNRLGSLQKPPTLLELNIELLRVGVVELLWCVCFLPFFYLDFSEIDEKVVIDPSPEDMCKLRKMMYTNVEMVTILKEVLPEQMYKGILACLKMVENGETIQYNKDELNPPDFLNKELFEKVLRKEENDKALKITSLKLIPGTRPGDHFASVMFKAIVSYTSRGKQVNSRSLVVKTMPIEEGAKKDLLEDAPIFDREIEMYTEVLPEMKRIMESIGDNEIIAPRLIHHSKDPTIIIFEDISPQGYKMHDGLFGFDNTVKVLKKLAKYHALSYYMNDNKYNTTVDFAKYATMMTDEMIEKFKPFIEGFDYLKTEVDNWPGYETVAEKLATQNATFSGKLKDIYAANPEPGFNVLCHGDFHIKNMMFIKNGEDIDKTMFLDFQISFWGSPAIDLIYILYAIGDADCRKRRGELLSIYHEAFCEYLNRLGCFRKSPTLLELNIEILKKGAMEILMGVCFMPFFHMDYTKVDPEAMVDSNPEVMANMKKIIYANEGVVKVLREVLPEFLYKGIRSLKMVENGETIQYNKDEVNPPDFLNKELFEKVLRKEENDKALTITSLKLIPGTRPGDHFASVMFKAIVSYTSRGKQVDSRSLVVKTMPVEEGLKKDMLENAPIFDREIEMYTEVLPEMKRIMESIGDNEIIAPKLIHHSKDPTIIIFEDISPQGYKMHDGLFGFDNTVKVLKKLAKYHALSYYMNDNKYNTSVDVTKLKNMMSDEMIAKFKGLFEGFDYLKAEVDNWPGYEVIAEKLATQNATFPPKLLKIYESNPEPGFNVLCHGDFHIKNMMFIKNGEDIDKTMFLDFQISFWGSPAIDLIYILYAIGDADCRKRRGEILSIYHECFCDYLNRLGCFKKAPTLLDLNIEMLKKGTMEIMLGVCFLPFFALDFSKVDLNDVVDPTPEVMANMRKMLYANADVVKVLREILPDLLYKGILC